MSVEVLKRITEDVKEFDNKDDFIKYYELNKNELKGPRNFAKKFCIQIFCAQTKKI